ncbi:ketosteroid isomerase-like protein [Methylohalomonas lacus]|uniref:Ketosteroid isomerase-like protein n=1 Tax=Methylohalomonas lacus TaxID=398773 RepID=A0AAE3L1C6_9GAMM|nr:nuclear transport factor 2 family protein [Methylohalomonas lacus]MCS3903804.1 ketosteroid isomerase-like protein [Methylohalomonas lacus]
MKSSRLILLVTSLMLAVTGHGARAAETASDIEYIAVQNLASWNIAFNEGGLDQFDEVSTLYTEDAVLMTPSGQAETTTAGIRNFWKTLYDIGFNAHTLDISEVQGDDNSIIVTSRWEALRSPENDMIFEGRMISVLERQSDGRWRTTYQRWN